MLLLRVKRLGSRMALANLQVLGAFWRAINAQRIYKLVGSFQTLL